MKTLITFLREIQWVFLSGIVGFFIGAIIHNSFFKEFTVMGLESLHIVGFLFSFLCVEVTEIYRKRKHL